MADIRVKANKVSASRKLNMKLLEEIIIAYRILDDCVNCGACIDECSQGAIIEGEEKSSINPDKCTECGHCVDEFFCPAFANIRE